MTNNNQTVETKYCHICEEDTPHTQTAGDKPLCLGENHQKERRWYIGVFERIRTSKEFA
jgi:hypothetical protein